MMKRLNLLLLTLATYALFGSTLAQSATPPQGGVIRIAIQTQPETFNPVLPIELNGLIVSGALFAPLTVVNPETLATEPYLAKSWEVSDDLTTWTFFLHENARWHDGTPLTADDVRFTFERIADRNETAPAHTAVQEITSVEVVDDHTVRFHLREPNGLWPDVLSSGGMVPIPRHIYEDFPTLNAATEYNTLRPVGSGAFKIRRIVQGSEIEVEAFDDFFLGRPNLDGIIFKIVPDQNVAVAQTRAGDLDWVHIESVHIPALGGDPRINIVEGGGDRYVMMAINMREQWSHIFGDRRVRIAMFHAVDREEIFERIGGGMGTRMERYIPPSMAWVPEPDYEPYEYNPERARQLLEEAGWVDTGGDGVREKDGQRLSFYVLVDRGNVIREQIGLVLQQAWKDVGMDVEYIVSERTGRWIEETRAGTFPTRISTFPVPNADWFRRLFHTDGQNNSQAYNNPEVDALIDAVFLTADREEQGRLLSEAERLIYQDPHVMPFFLPPMLHAVRNHLREVPHGELKHAVPYAYRIYIER